MDYNDIQAKLKALHLAETFPLIRQKAAQLGKWELTEEVENLWTTYRQMFQFMLQGMNDPQSARIRTNICHKLGFLVSRLEWQERLMTHPEEKYVSIRKGLKNTPSFESIVSQLESLSAQIERVRHDELLKDSERQHLLDRLLPMHESTVLDMFHWTWTSEVWQNTDLDQANRLIFSDEVGSHEKAVFISAVTLSLLELNDLSKLLFLLDCYLVNDHQISQRALVGFLLVFHVRFEQVKDSQELKDRLTIYRDDSSFIHDMYATMMQLQLSCTTDSVSTKMRNDIMPALMKSLMSRNEQHKNLDVDALMTNGENPEWTDNENMDKKMQEMAELQLSGADIYYATFATLKGYSFFSQLPHWFYPFSLENIHTPALTSILSGSIGKLVKLILNGSPLCNSDKYSLCLTFQHLGSMGETAISEQIKRQLPEDIDMEELAEQADVPHVKKSDIRRQYIFDLYRFYHSYPYKQQFANPFASLKKHPITPLSNTWMKQLLADNEEALSHYADFLMRKEFYPAALQLLEPLATNEVNPSLASIWQKIGFCHQKLNHTTETIHAYTVANQLKPHSRWTLSHLASLCHATGQMEDAAKYYQELLDISPENLKYLLNASQSLMLCHRHEEALPLLYKATYLDEQSWQVKQLLAWCLMLNGKKEEAIKPILDMQAADADNEEAKTLFALVMLLDGNVREAYQQLRPLIDENNIGNLRQKLHTLSQLHLLEDHVPTLLTDALTLHMD